MEFEKKKNIIAKKRNILSIKKQIKNCYRRNKNALHLYIGNNNISNFNISSENIKKRINRQIRLQGEVFKKCCFGFLGVRRILADATQIIYCIGISKNIVNDISNFNLGCDNKYKNIYYLENLQEIYFIYNKKVILIFKNPLKNLEFYFDSQSLATTKEEYYCWHNYLNFIGIKYGIILQYC